jgi:hypothetical protein
MFWCWVRRLSYNLRSLSKAILLIIFPSFFHNVSDVAWTTTSFNCMPPSMCLHTSHRPYRYPPFTLDPRQRTHKNPWCNLWHYCRHCARCWLPHGTKTTTCVSFSHIQLLLLTNWHCVDQRWNLHPSWRCIVIVDLTCLCGFISLILHNSRICCLQCNSNQRKLGAIVFDTLLINFSL